MKTLKRWIGSVLVDRDVYFNENEEAEEWPVLASSASDAAEKVLFEAFSADPAVFMADSFDEYTVAVWREGEPRREFQVRLEIRCTAEVPDAGE